jgi:hypothetical protein
MEVDAGWVSSWYESDEGDANVLLVGSKDHDKAGHTSYVLSGACTNTFFAHTEACSRDGKEAVTVRGLSLLSPPSTLKIPCICYCTSRSLLA